MYRRNKDGSNEFLPLQAFGRDTANVIFLKYSKGGKSSSSHAGIRNVPIDTCYDDTQPYQVPSEKQGLGCSKRTPKATAFNVR